MSTQNIALLTSKHYREAVQASGKLIIPVASIEVLGDHGPLGADFLAANSVVPLIAEAANVLYAPTIPYGDTLELPQSPGSVDVGQRALQEYLYAVATSFLQDGLLDHLIFITFHSLNNRALDGVCRQLAAQGYNSYVIDWWRTVGLKAPEVLTDTTWGTGHGGEMITSVMMHLAPEAMRMEEETNQEPLAQFAYYRDHLPFGSSPFAAYGTFADYCEGGAWGDLAAATSAKGEVLVAEAVKAIVEFLANLRPRQGASS